MDLWLKIYRYRLKVGKDLWWGGAPFKIQIRVDRSQSDRKVSLVLKIL